MSELLTLPGYASVQWIRNPAGTGSYTYLSCCMVLVTGGCIIVQIIILRLRLQYHPASTKSISMDSKIVLKNTHQPTKNLDMSSKLSPQDAMPVCKLLKTHEFLFFVYNERQR